VSTDPTTVPRTRASLRSVALPSEHGGWGLTAEPALLGLLVAYSPAGLALAVAAVLAFLARTPLKLVLVDRWRHRRLPRTVLAERVAGVEILVLAALVTVAAMTAAGRFWIPLLIAAPFVAVELWFDMRSRSRRLVPELAGTVGIGSVVAAITLADGRDARLAAGLWLVVAARAVAALPFVRVQLQRLRQHAHRAVTSDLAQPAALVLAGAAVALDGRLFAGSVAIALLAALHLVAVRRTPPPAPVLGVEQLILGLAVVLVTAGGVLAS
jgi:YwiC-like protein